MTNVETDLNKPEFSSLVELIRFMVQCIRDIGGGMMPEAEAKINQALTRVTKTAILEQMYNHAAPSISWNHAKILAVHGQTFIHGRRELLVRVSQC
jgi:hypothetical protein